MTQRHRHRGRARPRRTSPGRRPPSGGPVDLLQDHAVRRRRRRRRRRPITGSPPATTTTVTGLTTGHDLHLHRPGAQPERRRARRRPQSNPVTPLTAVAPVGADRRRRRRPASQSARVTWTAPAVRRRQPDHGLHGDAVHRRDGADADAGRPRRRRARRSPGSTNGTALHVQGHGDQRASGTSPASAASNAVDAAGDDLRLRRRPATIDSGDTDAGRARRQVQGRLRRLDHRHPLLQGRGQHRHPRRQPVERRPARAWRRPRSPSETRLRLADASTFASPVAVTAGHDLRRVLLRARAATTRPPARGFARRGRQPAAARARQRHERQRRLRLRRDEHVPEQHLQRRRTTGSTCSTRSRRPARSTGVTASAAGADVGERVLDGARRAAAR